MRLPRVPFLEPTLKTLLALCLLVGCDHKAPDRPIQKPAAASSGAIPAGSGPRGDTVAGSFDDVLVRLGRSSPEDWPPLLLQGREFAGDDPLRGAFLDYYEAQLDERQGRHRKALELYLRVLRVFEEHGESKWVAATLHNLGALYSALGRGSEALSKLEAALALYRQLEDSEREAGVLTQMGWVFFLRRDDGRATALLEQALRKRTTLRGRAVTLDRLGSVHRDSGRSQEALSCYREALQIFEGLQEPIRGHVLANLGWLHLEGGQAEVAEGELLASLPLLRHVGDRDAEAHVLVGLARLERRAGRGKEALQYLEQALEIVEELRRATPLRPLRSTYLALRQGYFVDYIGLLAELDLEHPGEGYDLRAVQASEQGRARALLDVLTLRSKSVPRAERLAELEALGRQLTDVQLRVLKKRRAKRAPGEAEMRELGDALDRYSSLRELARESGAADSPGPSVIGAEEVQGLLESNTTVLDFVLGDSQSYLIVLQRDRREIHLIGPRARLEAAARELNELLSGGPDPLSRDQISQLAKVLGSELLGPVAGSLGRRLTVVKDGALHLVPFGLLVSPLRPGRSLIQDHEITVVPSLSSLVRLQESIRASGGPPRVALLAPDAGPDARAAEGIFPRLRFVEAEVRAIESRSSPDRLLKLSGRKATPEALSAISSQPVDVLHLATHAFVFQPFPELSAIVLTSSGGSDELVHLQDIFEMEIPARLVVLSGCETALGDLVPGEGMVSLAQAFLGAGASQTLVSLWQIDDASTAELMGEFYRELGQGAADPATALRRALLENLELHPYHWAAFELLGV